MARESIQAGKEMARFVEGVPVDGRVETVENVGTGLPDFRMTVNWLDPDGRQRTASTKVYKGEFERLKTGDTVELLVASDDPDLVMLKTIHENAGLVTLGSTHATPLVFFGLLSVVFGGALVVGGERLLGSS